MRLIIPLLPNGGKIFGGIYICLLGSLGWHPAFSQALDETNSSTRTVTLDIKSIQSQLQAAPREGSQHARSRPISIDLPLPKGQQSFQVTESSILHPDFAAKHPEFKTYQIVSDIDPSVGGRLTVTPFGIGAAILAPEGFINIHPKSMDRPDEHVVTQGMLSMNDIQCQVEDQIHQENHRRSMMQSGSNGNQIRTYRLAIVTTGEFYIGNGNNISQASAAVTFSVNSLQAIFERELAVRFQLLEPHFYMDPSSDPFTMNNRTREAAEAVAANFNVSEYDFGHVFHTTSSGGSGVAYVGVICNDGFIYQSTTGRYKAGGWSGSSNNMSNGWIGLAAHEFGHMFNMPHSFNGTGGNCTSNISSFGAYEIGSGSTIMSYQGSCSGQNVPGSGTADHYFHSHSIQRALDHLNFETCQSTSSSGNTPPSVSASDCPGSFTIPQNTPFRLTGSGSDADGDPIYYLWEQYDEDGSGTPTQGLIGAAAGANSSAPLFRSYPPSTSPTRTFPDMSFVVGNDYDSDFEPLPTVARTLNFRFIGRDWNTNGGGIAWDDLQITVANSGPFTLTAPNGSQSLSAGASTTVTWNTGGTGSYCTAVNIKLSVDGGYNYPYSLVANTANDGSETVTIPNGVPHTSTARIMVERADNDCVVFFDISDDDFTILSSCEAAASQICPTDAETFSLGSAGLNQDLNHNFVSSAIPTSWTITNNSPIAPLANATTHGGTTCQILWSQSEKYTSFDFTVSQAGSYSITASSSAFEVWSVFEADGYDPALPCNSTFMGSNSTGALNAYPSASVDLEVCTTYKLVIWTANRANVSNGTLSISGAGIVQESTGGPGSDYDYTYAALNTLTNQIQSVSASANFTTLPSGSYLIYGASYYSPEDPNPATVNPSNWIRHSVDQIMSSGQCVLFSNNSKSISVTGPCPNSLEVNDNPIASDIYHADQKVTSAGNVGSGNNVMFMAGNSIELMPNFSTESSGVLEIRIQGCN